MRTKASELLKEERQTLFFFLRKDSTLNSRNLENFAESKTNQENFSSLKRVA
jgi:hypothetical protein